MDKVYFRRDVNQRTYGELYVRAHIIPINLFKYMAVRGARVLREAVQRSRAFYIVYSYTNTAGKRESVDTRGSLFSL